MLFFLALLLPVGIKAEAADESSLVVQYVGDECIITGCDTQAEGVLDIPDEISGKTVTVIGENAFEKCKLLTEINIPDTVTEIGNNAFYACTMLRRLTMTDSVKVIGEGAFYQCKSLEEVTLSDSLIYLPKNAFYMCTSLKSISIPGNIMVIGENAFFGCSSLGRIVLPEGLISLSVRCFSNCSQLSVICLPSSIESIASDAFEKCELLASVYYTGTESDFGLIDISTGNECLEYLNVEFNHNHLKESVVTVYREDCTNQGYSVYNCPCGYVSKGDFVSAKGHKLKFVKTLKEATCTKTGIALYECSVCDYSESTTVSAKGHISVTDKKVNATCTATGKTKGSHCSRCGKVIVEQKAVSALGHDYTLRVKDSKHLASKATYKKAAKYYYSCSRCKKISSSKTFSGDKLILPKVKKLDFTAGEKSVTLKWKKISAARGYAVYKKTSDGKWTLVKRVRTNSIKIEKLSAGTIYNYAVRAYVKEGKSLIYAPEYTSIKVATKPLPISKISAKQNEKSITLKWNKSKGATGYRVYRYDTNKEKWIVVCSYTKSRKLTVKNLDSGRKYKFAVKACIDTGSKLILSNKSENFVTCTRPSKASVKSTALKYSVKLKWNKVKYADGYVVYMSQDANSGFKKVASTKGTATEIKKLSSGETYYFKVYAYRKLTDKNVYSYASEIKKVKTR